MKLWVKIALISVGVLLIAAVVLLIYSSRGHGVPGVDVMDGPGMVYTWTDYDLYGNWTEVNVTEGFNAGSIKIDANTITINDGYGNKSKYKYKIPDNVEEEGRPEGDVYLEIEDLKDFENIIFHFEELDGDGGRISVLSGTIFEYDGRGEIVVTEYVHDEDLYRVPSDFSSSLAKGRNSWEGVPPMMMNVETIPVDGGNEMKIPMQAMPGGSSYSNDVNAPKEIESTDITYFSADCNYITMANTQKYTYFYGYAAKADAGTIVALNYNIDEGSSQALQTQSQVALVSGDVLNELQEVVTEYDFVKNNGSSHYVNGLPSNFGGSVRVEYSSGEYISFSDNQSPIISPDAAEKTFDIIKKHIEKNSIKPLKVEDIVEVIYSEDRGEANYTIEKFDGKKLITESQYGKDGKVYKAEYDAPEDIMDNIRKIADSNALLYCKGLTEIDLGVYSISHTKLTFVMKDGSEVEVNECMRKPAQSGNCIFDIHMMFSDIENQAQ